MVSMNIYFQPPCHGRGHLPLDQDAQSLIQLVLEYLQVWIFTSSLGNMLPEAFSSSGQTIPILLAFLPSRSVPSL